MYRKQNEAIFQAAISAVESRKVIRDSIKREGDRLIISDRWNKSWSYHLGQFSDLILIGYGKASAAMAAAAEEIIGDRITKGLVVTKYGHGRPLHYCEIIEAGHPIPDTNSFLAGKKLCELCDEADERTLVINLVSGGGSALMEHSENLGPEEWQAITRSMLASGQGIHAINSVRKYLSAVKAGRLAERIYPAPSINLMISDVLGDDPSVIASGPTVANNYSAEEGELALELLTRYAPKQLSAVTAGQLERQPRNARREDVFEIARNVIIASNMHAVRAAEKKAKELGYPTLLLSSRLYGEAGELGKFYAALAAGLIQDQLPLAAPACIIGGGETTVTVTGSGMGGRNQELALSFMNELQQGQHRSWALNNNYCLLSAGTDGSDGETDANGAFVTPELLHSSLEQQLESASYLANNDSYNFFQRLGGLHCCGPTGSNVGDIQILIIDA